MFRVAVASAFVLISSVTCQARPFRTAAPPECNVTMPCDFSSSQAQISQTQVKGRSYLVDRAATTRVSISGLDVAESRVLGGRPAGCPRSFCGCGAAVRVFGRVVPELNLAANWLRFPRTAPAPGMVAARRGHVF